jgi:predicted aldo/keto reductase-like oxidoreductase
MQYRIDEKSGNRLSVLGFGLMRLPRGANAQIDVDKTEQMVLEAVAKGVNYFDTAWVYEGSEEAFGKVLSRNKGIREKIYIATKLPHARCNSYEEFDKYFNDHLTRLGVDYIDYYLIHNIPTLAAWQKACGFGIEKWIAEKKANGKIKQIGFSFHGKQNEFFDIIEAYNWDFCQIQYNYMNEHYQAGREGLVKAHKKGLMTIVMEPLLGGKLAVGLPKKVAAFFKKEGGGLKPASWALRWLWNQKEVTLLLSGMNSMEQMTENIKTAESAQAGMMSEKERAIIKQAESIFTQSTKIPCTKCNYCMPCPHGVNIPGCFSGYNTSYANGFFTGVSQYMKNINASDAEKNASAKKCKKCGKCEKQCPQHIEIIKSLESVSKRMESPWARIGAKLVARS